MPPINNQTAPTGGNKILVSLLCVAVYCCCSLQLAEACPFFQKKIDQEQQQRRFKDSTTLESDRTSEHGHVVLLDNQQGQRRTQAGCGGTFCYGSLAPRLSPLVLDWATLAAIAEPTEQQDVGHMEDSQSRENELEGFSLNNNNGGSIAAAGYTYLGQLLSHDVNSDESSTLGQPVDPTTIPNVSNPSVDLDTIYNFDGCRPTLTNRRTKFATSDRDFARFGNGAARICDSRNDNTRILSQITVAWMTLHNKFVDEKGFTFAQAREATIKEWQAVVLTDLLPNLLDQETLTAVEGGDRVLYVGDAKDSQIMPAEFSTAAWRLMHSRARANYRLNSETRFRLFDVGVDEPNLTGGSPLPEEMVISWERFFGDRANNVEIARILDMLYVQPLMSLPFNEAGNPSGTETVVECDSNDEPACPISVDEPEVCPANGDPCAVRANLALLDMVRGQTHSLPGGIAYAEYVQTLVPSLDVLDVADMEGNVFGLPEELGANATDVPLLLYLAHESILDHDGELLGALGSRIVAEVIYGLVETTTPSIKDEGGFVSLITNGSDVSMRDVLTYIEWQ